MQTLNRIVCSTLLLGFGAASAQTMPEVAHSLAFQYSKLGAEILFLRKTLTYSWGTQVVPNAASATRRANDEANFNYQVDGTERPANATTQFIVFKFRSEGFFETGGHFGVVGKSQASARFLRGRGFIIGKNKSPTAPNGCERAGPGAWVQPETWWTYFTNPVSYQDGEETRWVGGDQVATNWVGDEGYCGQANLQDGLTYTAVMHVGNGSASYWIYPEGSATPIVHKNFADDAINKEAALIDASTGYGFFAVFGGLTSEGRPVAVATTWTIRLSEIRTGWF